MRRLAKNYIYQSIYQIVSLVLPLITLPIVSRSLGAEGLGTWNFTYSVVNYFMLIASLGLLNYGARTVALARDDKEKLSSLFCELELISVVSSLIVICIFCLVIVFGGHPTIYAIQLLLLVGCMLDISWFFFGLEEFYIVTSINVIVRIMGFLLILMLIKSRSDLNTFVVIQVLTPVVSQAIPWFWLRHRIRLVRVNLLHALKHVRYLFGYLGAKVAVNLYQNIGTTMLGLMSSMAIAGIYANSMLVVTMSGSLVVAFNTVLIPKMTRTYTERPDKMASLLGQTIHFQLFLTVGMAFGIAAIATKFVPWFFDSTFSEMTHILPIISIYIILNGVNSTIASQYLIPRNDMKEYNYSTVAAAVVTIILAMLSIPKLGINGAVISTLVGQTFLLVWRYCRLKREIKVHLEIWLVCRFLIVGALMWIIVYFATNGMEASWRTTLVQVFLGSLIYLLFTFLLRANPIISVLKRKKC